MRVYRIEREKFLMSVLSCVGAALSTGFRWNSLHTRLVYTAESRALATLEVSVHLDLSEDLPTDRFYVEIDIPDDVAIQEVTINDLPLDWDSKPPGRFTQQIGDAFVYHSDTAVLKVPSSIVPQEYNYLINPLHPDAKKITVVRSYRLQFDSRMKTK